MKTTASSIVFHYPWLRILALICLLPAVSARAQSTYTWNGGSGTTGNWSDAANWGGSGPANPQGFLNFPGLTRTSSTNDFANGSPGFQIYFKTGANAFTLYGNSIVFYDFGGTDPNLQNEGAFTNQTINFAVTNGNTHLSGGVGILNINLNAGTAQGPLTFNGPFSSKDGLNLRVLNVSGSNAVTFNGVISDFPGGGGVMALTQLGTGTTRLSAANTYSGDTSINNGTLRISANNGLANSGNFIRLGDTAGSAGANLNLDGGKTLGTPINVRSGSSGTKIVANTSGTTGTAVYSGNLYLDNPVTFYANSGGANQLTGAALDLKAQTLTCDGPGTNIISGSLTNSIGSGGVTKNGTGLLILSGTNYYSGATTINAGEAVGQTGGSCSNSAVTVAGATNGVLVAGSGGQWACGALTYSSGTTYADFNFGNSALSTATAPLLVNGNLAFTVTPGVIVRSSSRIIPVGTYPLIKYTGTLSGTPPTTALSLPTGVTATLVNNTGNKSIDMNVTVGNQVTWAVGNATWDINTTANWKDTSGNSAKYLDNDAVLFDDTASGATPITVTLGSIVAPAAITANLTNKNYTISGVSNFIGSATLTKNGTGTLTIATTNSSFAGNIALNGGTLALNAGSSLGSGILTINNTATFACGSGSTGLNPANPIAIASGATATLTANTLSSGPSGNVTSADNTGAIIDTTSITYNGTLTGFTGTFTVSGGTTRLAYGSTGASLGSAAANFVVNSTSPGLEPRNQSTTVNLGALSGSGTLTGSQTTTSGNTTTYSVGALNTSTTFSGKFIDPNSPNTNTALVKVGSGTLTLSGNSPYTGATTVNAGALLGVTGGSCSNSQFTVNTGATNGVSVTAVGSQFICSNLTYAAAGTEYVSFVFGANTPSTTVAPLAVLNNLAVSGTLNVLVSGGIGTMPVGVYPLIKYAGAFSGTAPTIPLALPQFVSGVISNDVTGGTKTLYLVVTNVATPPPLVWNIGNGTWDTSSLNWTNSAGTLVNYSDGNSTLFDDTATGAGPFTVTLNTTVNPTSVTVSNVTKNYTLTGTGNITGSGGLNKQGNGTLVLATSNSFSGGTIVSGGTLQGSSATLLGNINNNAALIFDQGFNGSNSAAISGTGSLTKQNSGTLALGGNNTYLGKTFVNAGTLAISAGTGVGGSPASATPDQLTINGGVLQATNGAATITLPVNAGITLGSSGATIDVASGITLDYPAQAVSGTGALVKNGAGTFETDEGTASSTYTSLTLNAGAIAFNKSSGGLGAGPLIINGGLIRTTGASSRSPNNPTIQVNGDFTLGSPTTAAITFANGGAWTLANGTRTITVDTIVATITGVVGDGGNNYGLTKAGSGTLALNNSGTWTGPTTISAGALKVGVTGAVGPGNILSAGTLQLGNGVVLTNNFKANQTFESLDVPDANATAFITGPVGINGGNQLRFEATGSGAVLIFSNSVVTGNAFVYPTRGNLVYAGNSAVTSSGTSLVGRSAGQPASLTIKDTAACTFAGFQMGNGGGINSSVALTIQDAASLTTGSGTFDFLGASIAGPNTASLNGGSLAVGAFIKSAANVETLSLNGGTIAANASSASFFPSLTGLTANVSTNGITINDEGFTITIAQPLAHDPALGATADGGLVKSGNGTTTLSGVNTYTGNTLVNAGTLVVNGSILSPFVNVNTNGTLGGLGAISGIVTNDGLVNPGVGIGTLTLSNTPVLNGGLVMELNRTNVQTADLLSVTAPIVFAGTLTVTNLGDALQIGDTFTLFNATSYSGAFAAITLPALTNTLVWNTNNLATSGTISVVAAGTAPVITGLTPLNAVAQCSGGVTFNVTATGTAPLSYQWSVNGAPVGGATSTNFILSNIHFPTPITVTVAVTNGFGNVSSNSVVGVIDTIAPAIMLNGVSPMTVECHGSFTDPGATALDACAGSVAVRTSGSVNANTPGSYTLTYTADDGNGNTNSAIRTVNVVDTTPPVITYNFTNLNLSVDTNCSALMPDVTGTNFILAADACSAVLTITQTPTNNAVLVSGTNEVVLAVDDGNGNTAYSTNTVVVSDTTAPVITLYGANPLTVECHGTFGDPGATATDNCTLAGFTTNGVVNVNSPGSYVVAYVATDAAGNSATNTRLVNVMDTTAPVITLNGANPLTVECHGSFTDPGATATDACAGSVAVGTSGTVNASTPGSYTLTYTADDGNGNTNSVTRNVVVVDTTPPVITYNFTNLNLSVDTNCSALMPDVTGTNYILAADACSSVLTITQTPTNNAVLTLGTNEVVLAVNDGSGNTAYSTNTVVVQDTTPPVIALLGANPLDVCQGSAFADPGATATDNCTLSSLVTNNTVNVNLPGTYAIAFIATDAAGNSTTNTRTVNVNPLPTVSVNSATNCGTASTLLTASTSASNPSYFWSPGGATTASITVSPALTTTYTVTVTDGNTGCANSGSGTITVNPLPTITLGTSPTVTYGSTSAGLPYTGTSGSPNHYSITYDAAALAAGFANVALTSLPATPITLAVPGTAGAGTYHGTLTVNSSSTGCSSTGNAFTVTVSQTPLTITASSQAIRYGDCVPAGTVTYSGFVNGETNTVLTAQPTVASAHGGLVAPGTYPGNYTASGAAAANYSIAYVAGSLTVNLLPTSATWTSKSTFGVSGYLAPGSSGLAAAGSTANRGLAFASGFLYYASGSQVFELNPTTGALIGGLANTGISGGTLAVDQLAAGADGVLYVGNLPTSSSSPFKVYKYANPTSLATAPTLFYSGNPGGGSTRLGDTLAAIGSGASTYLVAGSGAGAGGYTVINGGVGTAVGVSGTPTPGFNKAITFVNSGQVIGLTTAGTYYNTTYSGSVGTLLGTVSIPDSNGNSADRILSYNVLGGAALLAVQSTGDSHCTLYSAASLNSPVYLGTLNLDPAAGVGQANANGTGELAWGAQTTNPDGSQSQSLYTLSTGQGIQAFVVSVSSPYLTPQFSGLSSSSISYGTASVVLTGKLGTNTCNPVYPAMGDAVTATINGHAVSGTVTDATGDFSITYNDPSLATDGVNTYTITYAYAGNSGVYLSSASDASTSLTVTPASQSITFGALANQTYGVAPYALNATASSGLAVSFSVVSGPATVLGSNLTITGAGVVTVAASQAGNANYNAATPVTNSFTVSPLPVVLTGTRAYDGTATAASGILSVSNKVGGDDVAVASGSATLASSWVGTNAITSAAGLTLGGTTAPKYTLTGASGAVSITNPHLPITISQVYLDNTGTNIVFVWNSIPGVVYQVQSTPDLSAPRNTWTPVGAPVNATATQTTNATPVTWDFPARSFFDVFTE